jgi:hypothetical protein
MPRSIANDPPTQEANVNWTRRELRLQNALIICRCKINVKLTIDAVDADRGNDSDNRPSFDMLWG